MTSVVIVDYGMGNLRSIMNVLDRLNTTYRISSCQSELEAAGALLLPGVGAFGEAMKNIRERSLQEILPALIVQKRIPVLGICLGMQLLFETSEENGLHDGLGILPGRVTAISDRVDLPTPHVGWNEVIWTATPHLATNVPEGAHFYFDHSFEVETSPNYCSAYATYGGQFTAAVEKGNIFATQFHPEKSQINGLRVVNNFLRASGIVPC